MCGLVGFLNRNTDIDPLQLKRAASALRHRGPDREGIWFDATAGIGLGHCRLSILELSSAGDQPMISHSGQYVLVYNGEVYNHLTPRENLKAESAEPEWMGHSDTETLLAAISAWDSVGEKPPIMEWQVPPLYLHPNCERFVRSVGLLVRAFV